MIKILLLSTLIITSLFSKNIIIATGESSGSYYKYGEMINKNIFEDKAKVLKTTGSVENMLLVANGKADIAFVQADALDMLDIFYKNTGKTGTDLIDVVGTLYSETLHIIVNKDSGIMNVQDLNGKIMSCGGYKSGSSVTASYIEKEFNLEFSDIVSTSILDGLELLKKKKIDVLFYVSKSPSDLLKKYNNIKLIDVKKKITNNLHIKRTILKKEKYNFLDNDVFTYKVNSLVIVKKGFRYTKDISKYLNINPSEEQYTNLQNKSHSLLNIPTKVLTKYTNRYGNRSLIRINFIDRYLEELKDEKVVNKLYKVNQLVNRIRYNTDKNVWSKENIWTTPLQSLGTGFVDIEEYALIKYLFLTKIGIDHKKLKLIQKDIPYKFKGIKNENNITLAYFHKKNNVPIILDYKADIYKYKNKFNYKVITKSNSKTWEKMFKNRFNEEDGNNIMSLLE